MNINQRRYENLIYYTICETLYQELKNTNYTTFNPMIQTLKISMERGELSREQYNLVVNTIKQVELIYALEPSDSIKYFTNFMKENMWNKFINQIKTFKTLLKNAYQI